MTTFDEQGAIEGSMIDIQLAEILETLPWNVLRKRFLWIA